MYNNTQKPATLADHPACADCPAPQPAPHYPTNANATAKILTDHANATPNPTKNSAKAVGKIPIYSPSAEKKRIHPRFVNGKYQRIRLVVMYSILLGFLLLPWLRWDGRQAVLFDVGAPKFYIFGAVFMPQDFYFFAFVFMIAAIALFMVTVYAGRVWCGYACPQTIYVHLYQYTEKLIIGERHKRLKFDNEKFSPKKFAKLTALHSLWGLYSVITAFTFVALVVSTDGLLGTGGLFFADWSKMVWLFMGLITFVTYINASYMREHMCVHICPYGRFQSVMFDKDTLIVSYDSERGEPRGARKKGKESALGDCIDCTMCVQVCPTGIDIRNGLQADCIQCAACVDACNEVMDKVQKPRGLIRYTTERQLVDKQPTKVLSPRIFAYVLVLGALIGAAGFVAAGRAPLQLEIRHDRKQLASVGRDGRIENSYIVKIVNKTQEKHIYKVKLEPIDGISLSTRFKEIPIKAGESYDLPVSLFADPNQLTQQRTPITLTVATTDDKNSISHDDVFFRDNTH